MGATHLKYNYTFKHVINATTITTLGLNEAFLCN